MNSNNLENMLPKKLPNLTGNQIQISNIEHIDSVTINSCSEKLDGLIAEMETMKTSLEELQKKIEMITQKQE